MRIFKNKSIITLAAILLFNIAFFAVIANVFPIRFEENDDVLMASIANGTYLGEPDCHLVFINALYGCFLAMLYRMCPSVEWYTYMFAFFQISSITVASYYTIKDVKSKVLKISLLFALFSLWSYVVFFLQFTTVAGLLAFASVILFHKKHFYLGGIFFCLSVLVRYHCAGMVFILSVPILIYEYGKEWKNYLKVGAVLAFAGLLYLGNNAFYQEKEWKEYKEYNEIRGKIADNPNKEKCKLELLKIMSESDFILICYFFHDPDVMTVDLLRQMYGIIESNNIENKFMNVTDNFISKYKALIGLFFFLVVFLVVFRKDKRIVILSLSSFLLWLLLVGYISLNSWPKYRVVISSILLLWYVVVVGSITIKNHFRIALLSSLLIVGGYIVFVREIRGGAPFRKQVEYSVHDEQTKILRKIENKRIVPFCTDLRIEYYSPFKLKDNFSNNRIVFLGWLAKYPLKGGYFTYRDFKKNDVLLFASKKYDSAPLQQSMREHYGLDTDTIHVKESENYALIKFVQK